MNLLIVALMSLGLVSGSVFNARIAVDREAFAKPQPDNFQDHGRRRASLVASNQRRSTSISPYEIKQYIEKHRTDEYVSLADYWNRLGIDVEAWEKYGTCEAALFEITLGRGNETDVMLRLYDPSGWSMGGTRYLFFKPIATARRPEWQFLGYLDFEDQRYAVPDHSIITSGSEHWFVLTIQAGRGSGYSLYYDYWYEINNDRLRLVLSYPSGKFRSWIESVPVLEASSEIISATTESDRVTVVIEFTASYVRYGDAKHDRSAELWAKTQRAVFVRRSEEERFRPDTTRSELAMKELDAIYDGEGPSNSEILRYNVRHLERIAAGADEGAKEWLRAYLAECKNTPEREHLLRVLGR